MELTQEESRALIEGIFDAISRGDMDAIDKHFAEDYVDHNPLAGELQGREAFKQQIQGWREAFPDVHFEVSNVIASGDMAAWMVRFTGTNTGPLMGMPPTGKKVDVLGINMGRINDKGQAAEHWDGNDIMQMMQQLGLMPEMAPEGAG